MGLRVGFQVSAVRVDIHPHPSLPPSRGKGSVEWSPHQGGRDFAHPCPLWERGLLDEFGFDEAVVAVVASVGDVVLVGVGVEEEEEAVS